MDFACSSLTWQTQDGKHLLGRTYDQFGCLEGNRIIVVPRGHRFKLELAQGDGGWAIGRWAFMGMAVLGLPTPIMVDGVNEKGLMGALLNFYDCAAYNTNRAGGATNLHPGFLVTYLLSRCENLGQVVAALAQVNLTGETICGERMSVHYLFTDRSGEAVVVEPLSRGVAVHRNTIGVLANSPDYLWHLTNLNNYVGVTNLPHQPQEIAGRRISEFGQWLGGGFGLPGDYSSPSRFVRVAFMKQFAVKGKDEMEGVTGLFHILDTVSIPKGLIKKGAQVPDYESTLCTSVLCGESLTYYFATAANRRISAIRLDREKERPDVASFHLQQRQDVSYLN